MASKGKQDLDQMGPDHLRILFKLKNARLYPLWIE
jgi:hypothetical protein